MGLRMAAVMQQFDYMKGICCSLVPRFYLASMEKNREKAWDQNYVMDRKWWTRLVRNVDSVCTNRVHHFWSGPVSCSSDYSIWQKVNAVAGATNTCTVCTCA